MTDNPGSTTRRIKVVALACVTSVAITLETGLPIVRIVAREDDEPLSGDVDPEGWAVFPFDVDGAGPWPAEVSVLRGCLALDLPSSVSIRAYEAKLHEALARNRFRIPQARDHFELAGGRLKLPIPDADGRFRAISGTALFAIDPTQRMPVVARLALAARRAAIRDQKETRP